MPLEVNPDIADIIEKVSNPYDLRNLFPTLHSLRMAEPGDGDGDEGDGGDDGDDGDDGDEDGSGGTGKGSDDGIQDPEKKRLSDEAAKYRRLRRQERERAEAAEAKVREFESKGKDEAGKLQVELEQANKRAETAEGLVSQLAREVAISRATRGKAIADPDYLEHLLDKQKVEFLDEDGEIADISDVVDKLLKEKPSLLVATSGDDSDDEDDATRQPSGSRTDGKKGGKSKNGTDFETLAQKFPALAQRR